MQACAWRSGRYLSFFYPCRSVASRTCLIHGFAVYFEGSTFLLTIVAVSSYDGDGYPTSLRRYTMRRIVLSALFLSPVVLHAQANLSPVNQSILRASVFEPKGVESLLAGAATARTDRDPVGTQVVPDSIQTVITSSAEATQEFADAHDEEFTTGQHIFTFNGQPTQFEAPKLVHWTPIHCVESELDAANASEKKLQISMVISQNGAPEDIKILHSVDPVLDHKAVEALSQYRFTPAMMDHRPAAAPVTVSINFPAR
jgi:hypothetical protein